jgi:hypothetical protein
MKRGFEMLIRYIRDYKLAHKDNKENIEKSCPYGCIVALDKDKIGWAFCNPRDKWNRKLGLQIARNRALSEKVITTEYPLNYKKRENFKQCYDKIKILAEKYFKDKV